MVYLFPNMQNDIARKLSLFIAMHKFADSELQLKLASLFPYPDGCIVHSNIPSAVEALLEIAGAESSSSVSACARQVTYR